MLEGDPARRIVELARLRDVDLIVVGSRGLGAFAGTLLGSVSHDVDHADRPVLVAARKAARRPRCLIRAARRSTLAAWKPGRQVNPGFAPWSRPGWPWPPSSRSTACCSA